VGLIITDTSKPYNIYTQAMDRPLGYDGSPRAAPSSPVSASEDNDSRAYSGLRNGREAMGMPSKESKEDAEEQMQMGLQLFNRIDKDKNNLVFFFPRYQKGGVAQLLMS